MNKKYIFCHGYLNIQTMLTKPVGPNKLWNDIRFLSILRPDDKNSWSYSISLGHHAVNVLVFLGSCTSVRPPV